VIESDRLVSANVLSTPEDANQEPGLRPLTLSEYIGQAHVHSQMEVFIPAARKRFINNKKNHNTLVFLGHLYMSWFLEVIKEWVFSSK